MHIVFFLGGHLENHPKWQVGPKLSSANILITNQGSPINNIIPLPEGSYGCMVTLHGPWTNRIRQMKSNSTHAAETTVGLYPTKFSHETTDYIANISKTPACLLSCQPIVTVK